MGEDGRGGELVPHIAALRRYARALLGNAVEADDLVQECLIRALAQTRPWDQIRNARAYLFTILHNVHVDRRRSRSNTVTDMPLDHSLRQLSYPAPQPRRLELNDLAAALKKLPEEQRKVILLVAVEGMSYAETAKVLGIPIGTVMSRLSRGRETLRQMTAGNQQTHLRLMK